MPERKQLLTFLVERGLLRLIDDFRFAHRFPSRAAALTWLLRWAIQQKPTPEPSEDEP